MSEERKERNEKNCCSSIHLSRWTDVSSGPEKKSQILFFIFLNTVSSVYYNFLPKDAPLNSLQECMKRSDINERYEKIPRMILQNSDMLDFPNIFLSRMQVFPVVI